MAKAKKTGKTAKKKTGKDIPPEEASPPTIAEKVAAKAEADAKAGVKPEVRHEAEVIMHGLEAAGLTQFAPHFTYVTVHKRERIRSACSVLCGEQRLQTFTTGHVWRVVTDDNRAERAARKQRELDVSAAFERLEGMMPGIVFENGHYAESPHEGVVDPVALLNWIDENAKAKG